MSARRSMRSRRGHSGSKPSQRPMKRSATVRSTERASVQLHYLCIACTRLLWPSSAAQLMCHTMRRAAPQMRNDGHTTCRHTTVSVAPPRKVAASSHISSTLTTLVGNIRTPAEGRSSNTGSKGLPAEVLLRRPHVDAWSLPVSYSGFACCVWHGRHVAHHTAC